MFVMFKAVTVVVFGVQIKYPPPIFFKYLGESRKKVIHLLCFADFIRLK